MFGGFFGGNWSNGFIQPKRGEHIPLDEYPIGSMYAIYGNMDLINIPQMLAYILYMDPMGMFFVDLLKLNLEVRQAEKGDGGGLPYGVWPHLGPLE